MNLKPRIITGHKVQLEPLTDLLFDPLCECLLQEPDGWFSTMFGINSPQAIITIIENWTKANHERRALSFVIRDLKTSKVAGLSHFLRIDEKNFQLDIGGTQVGKEFRRSHINTETKYLMLKEAFENLKVIRVTFRVDTENFISEKAMLRIGAKYEGTIRNGGILPDGRKRDYKIYGIIDSEWPSIKNALQDKMLNEF